MSLVELAEPIQIVTIKAIELQELEARIVELTWKPSALVVLRKAGLRHVAKRHAGGLSSSAIRQQTEQRISVVVRTAGLSVCR
ncbi:hypothetical protein [Nocardia sp. NPDC052112]|uniref:hypothetical protein n=1 Tax=Nocardia sp. NPDC052112 TaxID=3155646 RepID=UPI00343D1FC6